MPMHNWKRVPPTIYHHFHQQWTISICDALNAGLLPPGYSGLVERYASAVHPDLNTVQRRNPRPSRPGLDTTTLEAPRTRMVVQPREGRFHERANRVVVRHHLGEVVSVIEVVSPGNKSGRIAVGEFDAKAVDFLRRGINLLVIDPFPPGSQDPQSLHKLIWDEFDPEAPFELPNDEPLLLASYRAAASVEEITPAAFIEPIHVGADLPVMPVWLDTDYYVNLPLEATYRAAWDVCPADFRHLVEHGELPDDTSITE
jgi:hypothetical protein